MLNIASLWQIERKRVKEAVPFLGGGRWGLRLDIRLPGSGTRPVFAFEPGPLHDDLHFARQFRSFTRQFKESYSFSVPLAFAW